MASNLRAECAKKCHPQMRRPGQRVLEKEAARECPKRFLPPRRTAIKIGVLVNTQIHAARVLLVIMTMSGEARLHATCRILKR